MLTKRNVEILKIIVEEYLETGEVMGSKLLLKKYDLGVSSATVRNDMAKLENLNLVYQPYNSAGRLPTTKGLRAFVDYFMKSSPNYFLEAKEDKNSQKVENFYDLANKISFELAKKTGEISFFIIPEINLIEYNGIGKFLKDNFSRLGESSISIIQMLENKKDFISFIEKHKINNGINIFIGEENIVNFLKDYTIIIKKINFGEKEVFLGIIGSLKMNYSFNISAVDGII